MTITRRILLASAGACAAATILPARGQLAGRPISLIVPAVPGGTADISARMLAEPLSKILQTAVIVENKPGGNGNVAGQQVARGNGDGTQLLLQYSGFHCITPLLQPTSGFDPERDLKPVGHLIDAPQVLVVRHDFPANTYQEFIQLVRAYPGRVTYASSGNGSLQHVTTELLKDLTRTFMLHIPYRGTGAALSDLLAGSVDLTITTPPPLLPHIKAGKIKALLVTGRTRVPVLPQVPTAMESGLSLVASSWFAVYGPGGLSPEIGTRLSNAIKQIVESDAFRKKAEDQGARAVYLNSSDLGKLAADERSMWSRVVRVAKIKAD